MGFKGETVKRGRKTIPRYTYQDTRKGVKRTDEVTRKVTYLYPSKRKTTKKKNR